MPRARSPDSDNSDAEEGLAEMEMQKLGRQLRIMEGDRYIYAMSFIFNLETWSIKILNSLQSTGQYNLNCILNFSKKLSIKYFNVKNKAVIALLIILFQFIKMLALAMDQRTQPQNQAN